MIASDTTMSAAVTGAATRAAASAAAVSGTVLSRYGRRTQDLVVTGHIQEPVAMWSIWIGAAGPFSIKGGGVGGEERIDVFPCLSSRLRSLVCVLFRARLVFVQRSGEMSPPDQAPPSRCLLLDETPRPSQGALPRW